MLQNFFLILPVRIRTYLWIPVTAAMDLVCNRDFPHSPSPSRSGEVLYPPPLFTLSCPQAQEAATAHQQPPAPPFLQTLYEVTITITKLHTPQEPGKFLVAQNPLHDNSGACVWSLYVGRFFDCCSSGEKWTLPPLFYIIIKNGGWFLLAAIALWLL